MAIHNYNMNFGANVCVIRRNKGMTQRQLAEKCGLDASQISFIENGRRGPNLEKIHKIVIALDISFDDIFRDAQEADYYGYYP